MRHVPVRRLTAVIAVVAMALAVVATPSGPAAAQSDEFGDVPDDAYYTVPVAALAARGVFAGTECDDGFCPGEAIDRKTMAVWIVRVLDGDDPPALAETRFNDVDAASFYAPFIERMAELEVTTGCGDRSGFCPDRSVTRAQMAVFLSRAYKLPDGPDPGFGDVPADAWYAPDVARLAASGITVGCGDLTVFCPGRGTTRAQMATFLHRAENRAEPTTAPPYKAVDSGVRHACAVRSDNTVTCWGYNEGGQVSTPDGEFLTVSAGRWHNCGLRPDRTISCWGFNGDGQLDAPAGEFSEVSAGDVHNCALRTDGTAVCWGSNRIRKAEAPSGEFTSVHAANEHSCGLRADGTITCWGSNGSRQLNVPEGNYRSLSTGQSVSCAVRTDGTVACWGSSSGQWRIPGGQFSSVSAGSSYACGIRPDNTIGCWGGDSGEGLNDPPVGEFSAMTSGPNHSCALRTDGTVTCWGDTGYDPTAAPPGNHSKVTAGGEHSCALRSDGLLTCWGDPADGRTFPPVAAFRDVSAGRAHTCGVLTDDTIACWGQNHTGQADPPDGRFSAVSSAGWHSCGLKTDGTVACWGQNSDNQTDAPSGEFQILAAGRRHTCAMRADGTVTCWGENDDGQTDAPEGNFIDIAAGNNYSCGVRADNTVVCWGDNEDGQTDAPEGSFINVAAGSDHSCGVRTDNTAVCWGANWWYKSNAPQGSFKAITVDGQHSCGLRTDDTIACWGINVIALPAGAERVTGPRQPDPSVCRPYGPDRAGLTAGFPLPEATASKGTLTVVVLFVDFPDIRARHTTYDEAARGLPYAEAYMESISYGQLDVEFRPLHRWLRARSNHDQFVGESPFGPSLGRLISREAIELADQYINFADYDLAMIVMPSTHFSGGNAAGTVRSEDGRIATTRVNTFLQTPATRTSVIDEWGQVAAHEIFHNMGLLDLYPIGSSVHERPSAPFGQEWVEAELGLMGLRAYFLASKQDQRLAQMWRQPNGQQTTAYYFRSHSREMLAWSRWQLGWFDAGQVRCITDSQATVDLWPVADPGEGTAMAAIPLSGNEMIVIESRRKINYDVDVSIKTYDNARSTIPSLLEEGVLVYTVDARVRSGDLPMRVAGDPGNGQVDDFPVLHAGDSVNVRGYTIRVVSDDGHTHTVEITRRD